MAYQQGPPGQPPHYGPPPGYGYPHPPPPSGRSPLFWIFVVGLPLVVLFSCTSAVIVLGTTPTSDPSSRPPVAQDSPTDGLLIAPYTTPPAQATAPAVETQQPSQSAPAVETPPANTQPSTAAVGATLVLQGRDPGLKVSGTVTKVFDKATPASDFIKPKTGSRYVAVEVQLANTGQAVYDDAPSNGARLIDDQGQQYSATVGQVREGVAIGGAVTVGVGDSRKGVIVFEVPEAVKPAKFQFGLDSGFADQKGEWAIGP